MVIQFTGKLEFVSEKGIKPQIQGTLPISQFEAIPSGSNLKSAKLYGKIIACEKEEGKQKKFTAILADASGFIKCSISNNYFRTVNLAKSNDTTIHVKEFLLAKNIVYISDFTTVMRCHVVMNVTPEVRQRGTVLLDKPDSVEAIKASPLKTRVSLKGKIVKVRPLQKIGINKTGEDKELLNVRLKDHTGVIPISLWGKHAITHQSLKVGDCISVEKGEKAVFQNKPTVNTWEDSTTITLLTEDMPEITDSDDETAHQSASTPPGTTTGEWVSLGNITKYEACKEKRCYLKKLTIDNVCPTCGRTYSVKCPSTMALIATVGLQLTNSSEVKTARIFTNALKAAYTQLCPGASLPDNLHDIEDSFFAALPKMCQMVINANNVVTD